MIQTTRSYRHSVPPSSEHLAYKFRIEFDNSSPYWVFAIHDGHEVDSALASCMAIASADRLREEDPFTAQIGNLPTNKFIVGTSRFQLDLNREKEDAVYLRPEQAWGLHVWKDSLPEERLDALYALYDELYQLVRQVIQKTIEKHGYFVVYDIHSYNVRRQGPHEIVDTQSNPEINLGTAHNQPKWSGLTRLFIESIRQQSRPDHNIDVRENVKFKGGKLSRFINREFGDHGCVFSIEFRKDFMDEWTGKPFIENIQFHNDVLLGTLPMLDTYFTNENRR